MKLTKEEKSIFVERHNQYLKEDGFLAKLFAKGVSTNLKKDPDLQKAIRKTDQEIEKTRQDIEKISKGDKEKIKQALSPEIRKALGFDY